MEHLDSVEDPEGGDCPDPTGRQDPKDGQAVLDLRGDAVCQDHQEVLEPQVTLASLEDQEDPGSEECPDLGVHKVTEEDLVCLEDLDYQEDLEHQENLEDREPRDLLDFPEDLEHREAQAFQDQLAPKEILEDLVYLEDLDSQEDEVQPELQASQVVQDNPEDPDSQDREDCQDHLVELVGQEE